MDQLVDYGNGGKPKETQIDIIPQNLQEVVNNMPKYVPPSFRDQARIVASYIADLDNGVTTPNLSRDRFRAQMLNSQFIQNVYIPQKFGLRGDYPCPEDVLPSWLHLQQDGEEEPFDDKLITKEFIIWMQELGIEGIRAPQGTYYRTTKKEPSIPKPLYYKCYIEKSALQRALESGCLKEAFGAMRDVGIEPAEMKLFEGDRLVLYFECDGRMTWDVSALFDAYGIQYRGPAQDVYLAEIDENGVVKVEEDNSNDAYLGQDGKTPVKYDLTVYNQTTFFKRYLELMFIAGKDPHEPYKTSFVWLYDKHGQTHSNPQILHRAEALTGYPVMAVASKYRVDELIRFNNA